MKTMTRYSYKILYKYHNDSNLQLDEKDIAEFNNYLNSKDMNQNMAEILHNCAGRYWKNVSPETANAILAWNWQLKDMEYGYVELISTRKLSEEELKIMQEETEAQISDGYNENPFYFNGSYISFDMPVQDAFEESYILTISGRSLSKFYDKIWPTNRHYFLFKSIADRYRMQKSTGHSTSYEYTVDGVKQAIYAVCDAILLWED